jgi:hypothetical protein
VVETALSTDDFNVDIGLHGPSILGNAKNEAEAQASTIRCHPVSPKAWREVPEQILPVFLDVSISCEPNLIVPGVCDDAIFDLVSKSTCHKGETVAPIRTKHRSNLVSVVGRRLTILADTTAITLEAALRVLCSEVEVASTAPTTVFSLYICLTATSAVDVTSLPWQYATVVTVTGSQVTTTRSTAAIARHIRVALVSGLTGVTAATSISSRTCITSHLPIAVQTASGAELVGWCSERAGAWLAVIWATTSGITIVTRFTAVTAFTLSVMLAVPAEASGGVAVSGVAIACAFLTGAQVQTTARPPESHVTVLT